MHIYGCGRVLVSSRSRVPARAASKTRRRILDCKPAVLCVSLVTSAICFVPRLVHFPLGPPRQSLVTCARLWKMYVVLSYNQITRSGAERTLSWSERRRWWCTFYSCESSKATMMPFNRRRMQQKMVFNSNTQSSVPATKRCSLSGIWYVLHKHTLCSAAVCNQTLLCIWRCDKMSLRNL